MRIVLSLAAVAMLSASLAHADEIFDVNLTLASGGTVTGTVTFNDTLTAFESGNLSAISVPNGASYPGLSLDISFSSFDPPGVLSASFQSYYEDYPVLTLAGLLLEVQPITASTVKVCTVSAPCGSGIYSEVEAVGHYPTGTLAFAEFDLVTGGSVTAETPEPSSIALLGTGILGGIALLRRRVWPSSH